MRTAALLSLAVPHVKKLGWPVRSTLTYGKPYNKIFNGCEW